MFIIQVVLIQQVYHPQQHPTLIPQKDKSKMSKKIFNNAFYLSMISLVYLGCKGQTFSQDKFVFDYKLNIFFKAVSKNDTIFFENNKNSVDTFILTKIDSVIVNPNQDFCLMCPRAVKTVFRNYRQYPTNYWVQPNTENRGTISENEISEEQALITISKSPQNDSTTVHLSFKNFECEVQYSLGKLFTDTLLIGNKYFSNYYILYSTAKSLIINNEDVELIYATLTDGIIAYKEKSGILRKRIY
jgi:hypothetical protein